MAKGKSWLLGLVCAGAAGVLLFCSPWVGEGMRRGPAICATVMIPSLFPFLILSDFVARTQVGRMLERPLGGVAKHLYHCPPQLAPAILMSWIGGYPAGARVLAGMLPPDGGKRVTPPGTAVGYMPQRSFPFRMTVRQNLLITGGGEQRAEELAKVKSRIENCNFAHTPGPSYWIGCLCEMDFL